ncbi:LysR family transcriptional regulator [Croceicoccus estronivorus]|nr:LysR family transcriptional regulator [Croceicoccus estronivorus]
MQVSDWNDYQAFLAIARSGHIGRAGAAMGVDPTTVGRRLRRLEARLGVTLFEQTRLGQVLTEAGEAMLANVEAMERSAARIAASAAGGNGPSGLLRVSVSEAFGSCLVAQNLQGFADRYPQLSIDIVANSGFLSPSKREADVAVTLSRPKAGPVVAGKLADYALQLYGSRKSVERDGLPQDHRALLSRHRLVGYIPDMLYAPELNYLDELQEGLAPSLRSSSILAQHRMIASGAGIGILPCFLGEGDPDLIRLLPEWRLTRSFWLVTHKDTRQLAKIRVFREWLKELVEENRNRLNPPGR